MTLQEYKYRFLQTYGHENYGQAGCGGPILTGMMLALLLFLFCGCKTQYIPVETIRTEIVHQHDTIKQTDSVKTEKETIIREARPEDSVMLAKMGVKLKNNERLLIMMQRELSLAMSNLQEIHNRDSVRVDSVQVPYPVPAQLSRWQSFCCDYGKLMLGGTILSVIFLVIYLIRIIKKRAGGS